MGLKDLFVKSKRKGEESVGLTQAELKEWVQALPLLDLPRCVVMLDAAIFRLTMSEYRDKSWYELLVCLFEPIGTVSRLAYEKHKSDISSSKESLRAILFFVRKLHLHFGEHCYHMLSERTDELDDEQKIQAAFFAVQSFSLVILRSYQLSMLVPKHVWLHFYYVYKLLTDNLSEESIELVNEMPTVYECKTALSLFSSPIVLSILTPYKLGADSLEDIYMILNETIDPSVFNSVDEKKGDYCFSTQDDRAPSLYQFYPKAMPELHFINQQQILTELRAIVDQGFKINRILLESLALIEVRKAERFESVGEAQIISGIANSYRFLYGQFDGLAADPSDQEALFTYADSTSIYWPTIISVYKKAVYPLSRLDCEDKHMSWEIVNESPSGVGILSQESYPVKDFSVGNFAQFNMSGQSEWVSGLVRWMNVKEGGVIALGLEFLARENIPVYLQSQNQKIQGYKSIAILGKYTFNPWPNNIIITQGISYREGEEVTLISEQNKMQIKLLSCLVVSKNCKIFSFKTEDLAL